MIIVWFLLWVAASVEAGVIQSTTENVAAFITCIAVAVLGAIMLGVEVVREGNS